MTWMTKEGVRLYPVAGFEENQHKLYNYNDLMYIRAHEEDTDEAWDAFYESERLLEEFNGHVHNGVAYVPYPYYCRIRDIIGYYDK